MNRQDKLLISNVPRNCSEEFLKGWVEARRYRVLKINLIRDVISGTSASFAYVLLMDESLLDEAARTLNAQSIHNQAIVVKRVCGLMSIVKPLALVKAAS